MDERLIAPLSNAGISLDEKSLIGALNHTNLFLASRAALVLGKWGKSVEIINALASISTCNDEMLSFAAMQSLFALGDDSWRPSALSRLNHINDPTIQIQTAELLAKSGNADGWDVIASAVMDSDYSVLALQAADAFDGKIKTNGSVIHISNELSTILLTAPAGIKAMIAKKIEKK
jgi:hypothetical protein